MVGYLPKKLIIVIFLQGTKKGLHLLMDVVLFHYINLINLQV